MSLAIAYSMKKKAKKAKGGEMCAEGCDTEHEHKYADGGTVEDSMKEAFHTPKETPAPTKDPEPTPAPNPYTNFIDVARGHKKAHGGEISNEMSDDDMVMHIMRKRYSKGGEVANDSGPVADFDDNQFDDLVLRDDLDEHYTGKNSGDEDGDEQEDEDRKDTVSQIMKSRKKKDKLPHPA